MRGQFRFVMHPDDERAFAAHVLAEEDVLLVDGPRWSEPQPSTHRSLEGIKGSYCIIWSTQDRPVLDARPLPGASAWYCESESFTIQFWRSQMTDGVLTEGRLAVSTSGLAAERGVEKRFISLVRHAKKHYTNSAIRWVNPARPHAPAAKGRSANPSKPDVRVWVAPCALQWLRQERDRCVKQGFGSIVHACLANAA
jgi:hypothetical protein